MGILDFLTNFDFVSPIVTLARDGGIGIGTTTLFAPLYGRHDGATITRILKRNGIKSWGWTPYGDYQMIHIKRKDGERAAAALSAAGVELVHPY